jgi:hypothetical protein
VDFYGWHTIAYDLTIGYKICQNSQIDPIAKGAYGKTIRRSFQKRYLPYLIDWNFLTTNQAFNIECIPGNTVGTNTKKKDNQINQG